MSAGILKRALACMLLAVLSLCWPLLRKVLSNRKKAA